MSIIIDGKKISAEVKEDLSKEVEALKSKGITPGLAVVLVGEDPASKVYVANKEKACQELGIHSVIHRLPTETTEKELLDLVDSLNADPTIDGFFVQSPVPGQIDENRIIEAIDPDKDVDGWHPMNVGRLVVGEWGYRPATPAGVIELIERSGVDLKGKEAVVVGRSNIVGKPVALMLLEKHATVTICHSRTKDLGEVTRRADVLVVAIGKAKFVTGDMVKPGATVIDVGINRLETGKLAGDVDFEAAAEIAGAITPVPGGVGPMTIAMLMKNTVEAAKRRERALVK
ncbi:MAG: bifunctional methylenetetrahydrofolate dehydrogenase/methenyltetrahydrofolate cyclohydrolase FolD [Candidatus Aquicultorales bacterium]